MTHIFQTPKDISGTIKEGFQISFLQLVAVFHAKKPKLPHKIVTVLMFSFQINY